MSRSVSHFANLVLLTAIGLIAGGCGATVYSPVHPVDPVTIFVADYGRHSSIFFPMGQAGYVEYSFGDWNFYALGHTSNSDGIEALFLSCSATLARRYARSTTTSDQPPHLFQPRIFHVSVARADMERVRDKLERRWHSSTKTRLYSPVPDTEFVIDPARYSWLYNCNSWTAQVLRDMRCKVTGITMFSSFHSGDIGGSN